MLKYRFRSGNSTTLASSLLQLTTDLAKQKSMYMYMQTFRYYVLPMLYSIHTKQNIIIPISLWANGDYSNLSMCSFVYYRTKNLFQEMFIGHAWPS